MVCHYCGHTEPVPATCPHCRVTEPVPMGFGTETVSYTHLDFKTVKTVSRALYGTPLLDERQRRFWEWVADYYMCSLGEVMRVALQMCIRDRVSAVFRPVFRPCSILCCCVRKKEIRKSR